MIEQLIYQIVSVTRHLMPISNAIIAGLNCDLQCSRLSYDKSSNQPGVTIYLKPDITLQNISIRFSEYLVNGI